MKRLIITLLCMVAIGYLVAQEHTFWFFPTTSVMIVSPGEHTALVNTGITTLRQKYTEEELITLKTANTNEFRLTFNGQTKLTQPHPLIAQGQPVLGEMHYGQYKKAFLYIKDPTFTGTAISFELMFAEQETFTNLTIAYFVVEKATNQIVYNASQNNVSTPTAYSHTITGDSYSTDTHKAVITISQPISPIPESEDIILQAASTERVIPPFRIVTDSPFAEMYTVVGNEPLHQLQTYFLVNTDFTATQSITVHFHLTEIYNPQEFIYAFCSASTGSCFGDEADVTISTGTSQNEYDIQFEFYGNRGSAIINVEISTASHSRSFPVYFLMPDYAEALVIQDLGGAGDDHNIIDALENGSMLGSFALFDTAFGRLNEEMLSNFDYIIWNHSGIYPNLTYEILEYLGMHVTERNGDLWVIGQNVAKSLGDTSYSSYANAGTLSFLQNILRADIATPASISYQLSSTENGLFESPIDFTLASTGPNAHHSTTALTPRSPNLPQIVDSNQNVKGVGNHFGGNEVALFDFDFASVPSEDAIGIMFDTTIWLPIDQDAAGIPAPLTTLNIYPNPAKNTFNINYKSEAKPQNHPEYSIYNVKGQKVTSGLLSPDNTGFTKEVTLSPLNLSSGIYFVRVSDQKTIKTSKILIIK